MAVMSGDKELPRSRPEPVDYKLVFDAMPGMCLILDGAFRIVAQNADHAKATLTTNKDIVGKGLFEVFPDNPTDSHATRAISRSSAPSISGRRWRPIFSVP